MSEPKKRNPRFIMQARRVLCVALTSAALCFMSSIGVFSETDLSPSGDDIVVIRDIVYYAGPEFHAQRHILDLYLPANKAQFPVLMFIHGGGWTSGNKSLYGFLGRTFARAGIGVVIANYRLTDGTPQQVVHPGHAEDVARAFTWVYNSIADFGGDPEKIFISGHSAGGHLVALLALDPQYLEAHGLSPEVITGVIPISGVYDVRAASASFLRIFGGDVAQRAQASPITHVGKRQPPFQIIYADDDLPGLGAQAVILYDALLREESEAELIEITDRTHITIIIGVARPDDEVTQAMLRFINDRI